jgi:hypothetical protein
MDNMMQKYGQPGYGELELLEYRRVRIQELLSEGIVSAEMEHQLTQKLTTLEHQVDLLKAYGSAAPQRHAA